MVHETLSHVPDEIVDFDDIAGRVAMMAGEVSAAEARVTPRLVGEFGLLPALVATPLALGADRVAPERSPARSQPS